MVGEVGFMNEAAVQEIIEQAVENLGVTSNIDINYEVDQFFNWKVALYGLSFEDIRMFFGFPWNLWEQIHGNISRFWKQREITTINKMSLRLWHVALNTN